MTSWTFFLYSFFFFYNPFLKLKIYKLNLLKRRIVYIYFLKTNLKKSGRRGNMIGYMYDDGRRREMVRENSDRRRRRKMVKFWIFHNFLFIFPFSLSLLLTSLVYATLIYIFLTYLIACLAFGRTIFHLSSSHCILLFSAFTKTLLKTSSFAFNLFIVLIFFLDWPPLISILH